MAHPKVHRGQRRRRPGRASGASVRWPPSWSARASRRSTPTSCASYLAGRVAQWQLPERWAFIAEVPKTSVGKFDKKVLRKRYAEGDLQVETLA